MSITVTAKLLIPDSKLTTGLKSPTSPTFTGCWWDPDADEVLEGQHAGQEEAVFGPDLSDGFSPAFIHHRNQGKGVKHGVEVHALADHVDPQQQAGLGGGGDT